MPYNLYVNSRPTSPGFDHHLIARAEARATGANAHELYSLIASYYGFAEMATTYPECAWRLEVIEHRLRVFCRTGTLLRGAVAAPTNIQEPAHAA